MRCRTDLSLRSSVTEYGGKEAVHIEIREAVQIETQARVNQDPVVPHDSQRRPGLGNAGSPATAWPRRTRGTAPSGPKGLRVRANLCLARFVPVVVKSVGEPMPSKVHPGDGGIG